MLRSSLCASLSLGGVREEVGDGGRGVDVRVGEGTSVSTFTHLHLILYIYMTNIQEYPERLL